MPHKLTTLLIEYKEAVRRRSSHLSLRPHMTKSGIYFPVVNRRPLPPLELTSLAGDIHGEMLNFETFEEFALAIESVAELAFMSTNPRGYYLFGGNFFIRIPPPPMLNITQPMIDSAIARRKARMNKELLVDDHGTPVQLERFIDSEQQVSLWVQGHSIHRLNAFCWLVDDKDRVVDILSGMSGAVEGTDGGECCPDFSCCSGHAGFPMEERKIFQRAGESTRQAMMMGALSQAFIDLGAEKKVHIAGSMTPAQLND